MDRLTGLTVCNVKGRFSVRASKEHLFRRLVKASVSRITSNFSFVTIQGLKYSVFANSNQVNVTGLKRFSDLAAAAEGFCQHFDVDLDDSSFIIDNSTVVGQLTDVSRAVLAEVASRSEYPDEQEEGIDEVDHPRAPSGRRRQGDTSPFVCVARTRWFPSIHLRPNKQQLLAPQVRWDGEDPRLASCTIFPTGRIVILGAKNLRDAHYTAMRASAYMFREPEFSIKMWDDVFYNKECITATYNPDKVNVPCYPEECTNSLPAAAFQVGGTDFACDGADFVHGDSGGCEHEHASVPGGDSAVHEGQL